MEPKRGRGRPRKHPLPENAPAEVSARADTGEEQLVLEELDLLDIAPLGEAALAARGAEVPSTPERDASGKPVKAPKTRKPSQRERRTVKSLAPRPSDLVDGAGAALKAVDEFASLVDENDPELYQKAQKLFKQYIERHGKDGEWMFERDMGQFLRPQPKPLEEEVGQPTMHEAREMAIAISDGRTLSHWESIASEVGAALRHVLPGEPFQIRLSPSAACMAWHKGLVSEDNLRELLSGFDLDAVFLFHTVLGSCIQQLREGELYLTVSLDELITGIGWGKAARRNSGERNRLRAIIWSWMLTFDGMEVVGTRAGHYRDPESRELLDLSSEDAMFRIMSRRMNPGTTTPDGRQIPLTVTVAPGPWVQKWKNNRQILSQFGNIRVLAQIPSGKAAGAWARCIGMVLLQLWREGASRAVREENGETIVQWRPFTRRQLLDASLGAEPSVKDVLASDHPTRAIEYWNDAIKMLKDIGFIAEYREVSEVPDIRQGWTEKWLNQKLDITPGEGDKKVAEQIGKVANARRSRNANNKKRGRPKKGEDD